MLEIIFIVVLCKRMGNMMRRRGYEKPFWFQFFIPVCWFGAEFVGGFMYGLVRALQGQEVTGVDVFMYLTALLAAVLATGAVFFIASFFSRQPPGPPPLPNQ